MLHQRLVAARPWIALFLLGLALLAGWGIVQALGGGAWGVAAVVAMAAVAALLAAFRLAPAPAADTAAASPSGVPATERARPRLWGWGAGALAILLPLGAAVHLALAPYVDWSLLLYPPALALGWCGETWLRGQRVRDRLGLIGSGLVRRRVELALLLAICLVGGGLRLWIAYQYPLMHGTVSDEPLEAGLAWELAHGSHPWPLYQTMGGAVALFQPIAAAFLFFGASMASFRLILVPISLAAIPAFYVLARQFVAAPAALCATALLAPAFWPAMLGALAFGWLYGAIFQALGFGLLMYGLRERSNVACAASGGILALCLYSYIGHRLMPLPAVLLLGWFLVTGSGSIRSRLVQVLCFALGFALVLIPWIGAVSGNSDLLYGDSLDVSREFQHALHQDPAAALGGAVTNLGNLILTLLVSEHTNDFAAIALQSQGLLDTWIAVLALLGIGYALARFWRPANLLLLPALLLPLAAGSIADVGFVNTYRLNSLLPAIFLAIALLLDRCLVLARAWQLGARVAAVVLVLVVYRSSLTSASTIATHLTDCYAMTGASSLLSDQGAEGILLVEQVHALEPRQAVFVVSRSMQEWIWTWLLHEPAAIEYNPLPVKGDDPSRWPMLYNPSFPAMLAAPRFWQPRLAPGQTGITYIVTDDDDVLFLPIVRRAYPGGTMRVLQTSMCPTFRLTTYTLSAQQLLRHTGPGR